MNERYHPRLLSGLALAMGTVVGGQAQTPISEPGGAEATTAPKTEATAAAEAPAANAEHGPFFRIEGTDLRIGKLPPVTFHGFASQGFLASSKYNYLGNTTHGSFELSEFGLNASMSPLPRTRVSAQAFLFDVGDVGRYNPVLDYAMVDYNFRDEIGIRGGRVRRPGGIYNAIQDIDVARTSVLLPQGVYDARWRDFTCSVDGGSLYGSVGLGKVGSLSYEVYGGMASLSEQGGVARLLQGLLPVPGVVSCRRRSGVNRSQRLSHRRRPTVVVHAGGGVESRRKPARGVRIQLRLQHHAAVRPRPHPRGSRIATVSSILWNTNGVRLPSRPSTAPTIASPTTRRRGRRSVAAGRA